MYGGIVKDLLEQIRSQHEQSFRDYTFLVGRVASLEAAVKRLECHHCLCRTDENSRTTGIRGICCKCGHIGQWQAKP